MEHRIGPVTEHLFEPPTQGPATVSPHWPLQWGEPLREAKYSQQQSKCNKRQLGSEPSPPPQEQMH